MQKPIFSEAELRALHQLPEAMEALADWHSCRETEADASDYAESARHHEQRRLYLRQTADYVSACYDSACYDNGDDPRWDTQLYEIVEPTEGRTQEQIEADLKASLEGTNCVRLMANPNRQGFITNHESFYSRVLWVDNLEPELYPLSSLLFERPILGCTKPHI